MAAARYVEINGGCEARGEIRVPGDKSITHRALFAAQISGGEGRLENFSPALDCHRTMTALAQMGLEYQSQGNMLSIWGPDPCWTRGRYTVDAGNSGTTARLFMGASAFLSPPGALTITGDKSLSQRPMERVARYLRPLGMKIIFLGQEGFLPLRMEGNDGLIGLTQEIIEPSAQVKSAVLLAGLAAQGVTEVVQRVGARDHTELMLAALGADISREGKRIRLLGGGKLSFPGHWLIPGDFSCAAWWLALAAVSGEVRILDVGINPTRLGFAQVLVEMGASLTFTNPRDSLGEPVADIAIEEKELRGTALPRELIPTCIDELPILAALATCARGRTVVRGASELRHKESDRLAEIGRMLEAFGADFDLLTDGFSIRGGVRLRPARYESDDHRLVMAATILAALTPGRSQIGDIRCLDISYPGFLLDFKRVCPDLGVI